MNLLLDPWIPAPEGDLSVSDAFQCEVLGWPRPDLDAAASVFLIGLLQSAIVKHPELCPDEDSWRKLRSQPPPRAALQAWWQDLAGSFDLLGDGPRFMQDFGTEFEGTEIPIGRLLPESPGENARRKCSDIVRWHQEVPRQVSLPMAAIMLLADGMYGTRVGRGFRQGMRGENAMMTLVEPDGAARVWGRVWLNVLSYDRWLSWFGDREWRSAEVFPWLAATRTSKDGEVVTPDDAHPLQAFWQMPKRNRLSAATDGVCDLTGKHGAVVSAFRRAQYGPNYGGWQHPLAPRHQDEDGKWGAVKIRRPHVGYDHWVGLTLMTYKGFAPAALVSEQVQRRMEPDELLRLRCCGWHLGSAGEAGAWVDATIPLITAARRDEFAAAAERLLDSAALAAKYVNTALRSIHVPDRNEFYTRSESEFYDTIRRLAHDLSSDEVARHWLGVTQRTILQVFDDASDSVRQDPLMVAKARAQLLRAIFGPKLQDTLQLKPQAA